jgi:hypothetical protein
MEQPSVLGMPLNIDLGSDESYTVSPLSAMVVMKGIDSDGNEVCVVTTTEGISPVEALGYAAFASEYYAFQMRKTFYAISEP